MKYLALLIIIMLFTSTSCLDAPRDNIYDPKNPNHARISGTIYEPDSIPIERTLVTLYQDSEIIESCTSDENGQYIIDDIEPNIYRLQVRAPSYYDTLSQYPESLWAEIDSSNFDLYLTTLNFNYDLPGTSEPYAFTQVSGLWQVQYDTTPCVCIYQTVDTSQTECAIATYRSPGSDFRYQVKVNVQSESSPNWQAGIVFRYQNESSYYLIVISNDSLSFDRVRNSLIENSHTISHTFATSRWYTIGVICNVSLITVEINNQYQFQILDSAYKSGYLGLWTSNQDSPGTIAKAWFDDVYIQFD